MGECCIDCGGALAEMDVLIAPQCPDCDLTMTWVLCDCCEGEPDEDGDMGCPCCDDGGGWWHCPVCGLRSWV